MKLLQQLSVLFVAGFVGMSAPMAQAAWSTDKTDAVAAPGSQAFPGVTFTFDTPYDLASLDLYIDYDQNLLSFNAAASTLSIGGLTGNYEQVLAQLAANSGGDFFYLPPTDVPGSYSLQGSFLTQSLPLDAGIVTLTGVFQLLGGFTSGSTEVHVYGAFGDAGLSLAEYDVSPLVSAIPEPEIWWMVLGGLGLIAARVRRKRTRLVDTA